MSDWWGIWRGLSAGVALVLVAILVARHVLEAHLRPGVRRTLDLVSVPLFAIFVAYVATDFFRPLP